MKYLKIILTVLLLTIFGYSIWLDLVFGIFTNWLFTFIMAGLFCGLFMFLLNKIKIIKRMIIIVLVTLTICSIHYWDYNSQKPFMRRLYSLKTGMTKKQVIEYMKNYTLAGQGKGFIFASEQEEKPDLDNKIEFLNFTHTKEGWGDSDWGYVYFIDDKLYKTGFNSD